MKPSINSRSKKILGWREWVALPQLNIPGIKAKIDTGAKTSAIHAFRITPFEKDGENWVKFYVHPVQKYKAPEISCTSKILEKRNITSSNGQRESRYVIQSILKLGDLDWPIEITLTNRDEMGFRMLLGRQAMCRRILVDPAASYNLGTFNDSDFYPL
jgi:ribosomal protein S6--L-glutamate ligase